MNGEKRNRNDILHVVKDLSKSPDATIAQQDEPISIPLVNKDVGCIAESLLCYSYSLRSMIEKTKDKSVMENLIEKKVQIDEIFDIFNGYYRDEEEICD